MLITECTVIGPFVTERNTVDPHTALVFEAPLPSSGWHTIVADGNAIKQYQSWTPATISLL